MKNLRRVLGYLLLPAEAIPVLEDRGSGKTVAAVVPYRKGRVMVLGAPGLAMNRALGRADLDRLADTENPRQERTFLLRWHGSDTVWLLSEDKASSELAGGY